MKRIKGCINPKCPEHKKSRIFKEDDLYCTYCREELSYICVKCHTPIPSSPIQKRCIRCEAEHQDKTDSFKAGAGKALAGAAGLAVTVGSFIFSKGKKS